MTCGGAPSEDSIMVLTLGSGLWIHYTIEQAETYYKGYSHATIEFENGATVTDTNGKTITYAELTLYLVNGAWTTTRPEGYKIDDGVNYTPDFISVGTLNHVYSDGIDAYGVALNYSTLGFEPDGGMHTALSSMGFSMNGEEIGVALWGENKVLLWLPANKCEADYNGYSHPTIVIVEGAIVTNTAGEEFTLGGVTLYLVDGKWTTSRPDGYEIKVGELLPYNGIAHGWNNAIYHGVSNTILCFGEYIRNENNEIIKCDFLGADNGTESHADPSNLANPFANAPIATALTVNGKPIGELYKQDSRVEVSYAHGYNYLLIAIPEYMLKKDGRGCVTLHIEDNTVFKNCLLSEVTLYLPR